MAPTLAPEVDRIRALSEKDPEAVVISPLVGEVDPTVFVTEESVIGEELV